MYRNTLESTTARLRQRGGPFSRVDRGRPDSLCDDFTAPENTLQKIIGGSNSVGGFAGAAIMNKSRESNKSRNQLY
jgi:hypothetical protein